MMEAGDRAERGHTHLTGILYFFSRSASTSQSRTLPVLLAFDGSAAPGIDSLEAE